MLRQSRFESCDKRRKVRCRKPLRHDAAENTRRRITDLRLWAGTAPLTRNDEDTPATAGRSIANEQAQVLMRLRLGHPVQVEARLDALCPPLDTAHHMFVDLAWRCRRLKHRFLVVRSSRPRSCLTW